MTPLTFHVLLALADRPRHGYGMIKEMEERSGGRMSPSTGALYLALQRLEEEGLIRPSGPPADERDPDARRKYYALTGLGRRVAAEEARRLAELLGAAAAKGVLPADAAEALVPAVSRDDA